MVNILKRTGARVLLVVHYKKLNGQRPTLDSFKDAMAIPQNANYVINIWRDRRPKDVRSFTTTFAVSKARNPNGEAMVDVDFDPVTGDYKTPGGEPEWKSGITADFPDEEYEIKLKDI